MYYVYILKLSNFKYYTGMTNNINRRLQEHISGKSISTRRHLPLALIFITTCPDKFIARRLEIKIKNKGAKKFLTMNKLEKTYSDITKFPDMLKFLLKLNYKFFEYNNEHCIVFPKHNL